MLKQAHPLERRAPNYLVMLLAVCGLGGTGYGVQQSGVSRSEADRAIAARNRYEDLSLHCTERQLDVLRGEKP